jgi:hypothetical protein
MTPTLIEIKAAYARKGYVYFPENSPYNVNIWGIRKRTNRVNLFDDLLGISCNDEHGHSIHLLHPATVDPGMYYLRDTLLNPAGTFILKPGQYRGCWQKGLHKGVYPCLVQKPGYSSFLGWRDKRLNGIIERNLDANGHYFHDAQGIDMHRSSSNYADVVGPFSAGCQVRQVNSNHLQAMAIIDKSLALYGNSFSYTLFDEEEVFPNMLNHPIIHAIPGHLPDVINLPQAPIWPEGFMRVQMPVEQ